MKTIGLIGGFSPESTAAYYSRINAEVRRRRGRLHSAPILLQSPDFELVVEMLRGDDWSAAARLLCEVGRGLYDAGAECIALCTHTMHRVAREIEDTLPTDATLLHVGDSVGAAIRASNLRRVCLFGSRYIMEQGFLSDFLYTRYGIETVSPDSADRERIHEILYDELYRGQIRPESRETLAEIALNLKELHGVEALLPGSAALSSLIGEETGAFPLPRFDPTLLHVQTIVDFALSPRTKPARSLPAGGSAHHSLPDKRSEIERLPVMLGSL